MGFAIGGPAFANAFSMHLRLLGRGEYHMPPEDLARRQHPVTWLRVRLLAHHARQMGHHTDADALEHAWDTIAEAMDIVEDYYGFYAPEFLPAVQQTLDDMLTETSPRRFTDQEVALAARLSPTTSPVHLVNHAWHQFWGAPESYRAWEENVIRTYLASEIPPL